MASYHPKGKDSKWTQFRQWLLSNLPERKAHSNLSVDQIPIRLGSQLEGMEVDGCKYHNSPEEDLLQASLKKAYLSNVQGNSQSSQVKPVDYPYWVSFRDWDDLFVGVVICRGTSPGAAANGAITRGIVESERATIKLLTELHWALLSNFSDRLLDEKSAMLAAEAAGFANQMQRDVKSLDNSNEI
jgi:hypothetical protein